MIFNLASQNLKAVYDKIAEKFDKTGGNITGNVNVTGTVSVGDTQALSKDSTGLAIGSGSNQVILKGTGANGASDLVLTNTGFRPTGSSKGAVNLGTTSYRFKTVCATDGNFSGSVTATGGFTGSLTGTASGNAKALSVATVTSASYNVGGNSSTNVTVDVSKTGYTPLCIVGYDCSNSNAFPSKMYLSGTTVYFTFQTRNSTAISGGTVKVHVLYEAN